MLVESKAEKVSTEDCPHWWVIEPPAGPTSHGKCKLCRAEGEFLNWSQKALYETDAAPVSNRPIEALSSRSRKLSHK